MSGEGAARLLRERADVYSRDAFVLRSEREPDLDMALILELVRDELRKCADAVDLTTTRQET